MIVGPGILPAERTREALHPRVAQVRQGDVHGVRDPAPPLLRGSGGALARELHPEAVAAGRAEGMDREAVLTGEQLERRYLRLEHLADETRWALAVQRDSRRVPDREPQVRPALPQMHISATATANPPPDTSWQLFTRPRAMASRMKAWRLRSRSRSRGGGPSSTAAPAMRAYSEPASPGAGSPTSRTALSSPRNAGPTSVATSASSPTMPISGVGAIAEPGASL